MIALNLDVKERAIEFARRVLVRPHLTDPIFDRAIWKQLADFGFFGSLVPPAYGGHGFVEADLIAMIEGLSHGGEDRGILFSAHAQLWASQLPLIKFGSEAQKKQLLPLLCSGALIAANAMTEPGGGSDAYSLKTKFREVGENFEINGAKCFITNAPVADLFLVYASETSAGGPEGVSCLIVPRSTPGLTVVGPVAKMGLESSPMGELFFERCLVPKTALLGKRGAASFTFHESMEFERAFLAASHVGSMERLLNKTATYAKSRISGRNPILQHQAVSHALAQMKIRLESSRHLSRAACASKLAGTRATGLTSAAKIHVSESYVQNCEAALRIFAGHGYLKETGVESELRDAMASLIYSGTNEINLGIVARSLETGKVS